MVEPLFGTVSPIWSAVPSPGLAWFQSPLANTQPIGAGPIPLAGGALGNGIMAGVPVVSTSGPLAGEPYAAYALRRGIGAAGTSAGFDAGSSNFVSTPVNTP